MGEQSDSVANTEADIRASVHDALRAHHDKDVRVFDYFGAGKDSPWSRVGSWWVVEVRAGHVGVKVFEVGEGPACWVLTRNHHMCCCVRPRRSVTALRSGSGASQVGEASMSLPSGGGG